MRVDWVNIGSGSHALRSLLCISISKTVIPAGIYFRLSLMPFELMQICSRQICAGIQDTWTYLSSPSMALDTRFPAGMTTPEQFVYKDERVAWECSLKAQR